MLQETYTRISGLKGIQKPILICNQEHRFIAAEQLREIDITPSTILLEPTSQNTAPAVAAAALKSISRGFDPILLVLPSDHQIKNETNFINLRLIKKLI